MDNWEANRAEIAEYERLMAEHDRRIRTFVYKAERVWIRALRISAGVAFALLGLFAIGNAPSVSDTPFAALTLGMLAGAVFCWLFGAWAIFSAFSVAFGAGPTRQEASDAARIKAQQHVWSLREQQRRSEVEAETV